MEENLIGTPIAKYEELIANILNGLLKLGIKVNKYELDHLGYQSSSTQDYEELKPKFLSLGILAEENVVGGRRVAHYKLHEPIQYQQYTIPAVEVIEPKYGQKCPSALEHVEFVITESFSDFIAKNPNISWDISAIDQPKFPMLKLRLSETIQVKFHHHPLLDIVSK